MLVQNVKYTTYRGHVLLKAAGVFIAQTGGHAMNNLGLCGQREHKGLLRCTLDCLGGLLKVKAGRGRVKFLHGLFGGPQGAVCCTGC